MSWANLLAVAGGGALGASTRYGVNLLFVRHGWYGLPAATFVVNVVGCLLAGLLLVWLDTRLQDALWWRNLLMVGFLGGLTTFSALGVEGFQLLRANRVDLFALTMLAHVAVGVLAVAAGWRFGQLWLSR
ncbi:MAG: CrcB family protein [Xanthomonadales bacterium]|nr:CrcB family protein [Xanthomonadales bacterium]